MKAIKKTYREIAEFNAEALGWLKKHPENTKFSYAVKRVQKRAGSVIQQLNDRLEEININNCAVDDKGIIMVDERMQFKFSREGLLARNKERSELFDTKIEIEPYIATEVPELPEEEQDIFADFVLNHAMPEQKREDNDK